jgi:hypothetical protein
LFEGDERTSFYVPVKAGADGDASNMAIAIKLALHYFPSPENESDPRRAVAIGALQGAISAHERRLAQE